MKRATAINCMFLDIGAVLLTNGWDCHVRKPDADIFRLALDIAQTPARRVVYIENTPMFAQIAEGLGIRTILHTDYGSTCAQLASLGLQNDEGVIHENG